MQLQICYFCKINYIPWYEPRSDTCKECLHKMYLMWRDEGYSLYDAYYRLIHITGC